MKKINICMLVILLALGSPLAMAQTVGSPVKVVCNDLVEKGGRLYIDAVIMIPADVVKSRNSLTLTPVLESSTQKNGLPSVLINGKNRQKVYNREIALHNLQDEPRYTVLKVSDGMQQVNYKLDIPFEPWMKNAKLVLDQDLCGCGKETPGTPLLVADKVRMRPDERYQVATTLVYISPVAETEKHRAEVGTAYLEFVVNKYQILPDFRNNATELSKIDNSIGVIVNDKNVKLRDIVLKGYASPEGSYKSNTVLAENRVKALAEYVRKKHDFPKGIILTENGSEDWGGFREKVLADQSVPSRDKVLAIIESNIDPDKKDAQLMALDGGVPYRYVLQNIYPSLRRSDYKVDYTVRFFTVEEGREVIKTNPKQLSLSEMFAVANSYETGSKEYNEVFDIAVCIYPNDPVANLNAANIALTKGDFDVAQGYLKKAANSPEAIHSRGVLNLMQGNLDEAEILLKQAKAAGVKEADANLIELQKKRDDNVLFDSFN
ncbi:DUF3868 domain-containing protein [Parabacteroides chinchillae]|uniref:OmpA family protein n=1 Tax=Parabacteroides chinchillae TaxID=871327 RepID=A0A8G2BV55_9BACT|nr:DUF3868 domain-containing protein [Parabacteroides chinchillae]SEF67297.1 OmpA family protein [Parabacteroides chinchillae]